MAKEMQPQCVLGNGDCPPECPLIDQSTNITKKLGDKFDPFMSRLNVVFGDAFNHDVNVVDIARVMGSCIKESVAGSTNEQNLSTNA